ncbi:cytochrome b-c1 complex subunit 7-like [Pteronotus mesoamericanus]|uniref:cytochrome b-c1 complex subunit 7-like n=1 Tax=Pteronotus mesoamericanus TaxID=1884717 RepID=UPI0023EB0546|nr:cytochrome b-c1 complex subunit 7-like [Pteronotus parnellii mesoamericanus]
MLIRLLRYSDDIEFNYGQHISLGHALSVFGNANLGSTWFDKLGLIQDNKTHVDDNVKEAIRRFPKNLYSKSSLHIKRTLDLSMRQQILPKEQWTKYEDEKLCLEPHQKEVIWERKEREEWAKK